MKRLFELEIRDDAKLVLTEKEYRGRKFFDFRLFVQSNKDGAFYPTTKGLVFGEETLGQIKSNINAL